MIVAIAAGAGPAFTFNPFLGAETMTGHIVRISGGDLSYNSLDYSSLYSIGLLLFMMTLLLNLLGQAVIRRYREVYERIAHNFQVMRRSALKGGWMIFSRTCFEGTVWEGLPLGSFKSRLYSA